MLVSDRGFRRLVGDDMVAGDQALSSISSDHFAVVIIGDLLREDGTPSAAVRRAARTLGYELGWDEARVQQGVSAIAEEAAGAGMLVATSIGLRP
jgi:hypothetical protein